MEKQLVRFWETFSIGQKHCLNIVLGCEWKHYECIGHNTALYCFGAFLPSESSTLQKLNGGLNGEAPLFMQSRMGPNFIILFSHWLGAHPTSKSHFCNIVIYCKAPPGNPRASNGNISVETL